MVKHIVLFTLKDGIDKDSTIEMIASVLESLAGKIDGLHHVECRKCMQVLWILRSTVSWKVKKPWMPMRFILCMRKRSPISSIC